MERQALGPGSMLPVGLVGRAEATCFPDLPDGAPPVGCPHPGPLPGQVGCCQEKGVAPWESPPQPQSRPRARLGGAGTTRAVPLSLRLTAPWGLSGLRTSAPQQERFSLSPTGRSGRGLHVVPRPHRLAQLRPFSHSARRSTRCCAPTSPAGARAPAAPSASCSTAARGARAGGPPPPRPRSPAARPPGAGLPPATGPGDGDCWCGMCRLGVGAGGSPAPPPSLGASCPQRNLCQRWGSDLQRCPTPGPQAGQAKSILDPPHSPGRGGPRRCLWLGLTVCSPACTCGSPCGQGRLQEARTASACSRWRP